MSRQQSLPSLPRIDALLRRYDVPAPAEALLEVLAGEPADLLRLRALSREVDRAALRITRCIANRREVALGYRDSSQAKCLSVSETCRCLADYREVGLRFAGVRSLSPHSAG